jgi:hypothetical protein
VPVTYSQIGRQFCKVLGGRRVRLIAIKATSSDPGPYQHHPESDAQAPGTKLSAKKRQMICKVKRRRSTSAVAANEPWVIRVQIAIPQDRKLRWSLDFVAAALTSGPRFRSLTSVDHGMPRRNGRNCACRAACHPRTGPDRRTSRLGGRPISGVGFDDDSHIRHSQGLGRRFR